MHQQIKTVGSNGQISLGKHFAGKTVAIEQVSANTLVIKCGEFIPDDQQWIEQELPKLETALAWTKSHPPLNNFTELARQIENNACSN